MLLDAAPDGIDSSTEPPAILGAEATGSPQNVDICDTDVSAESRELIYVGKVATAQFALLARGHAPSLP